MKSHFISKWLALCLLAMAALPSAQAATAAPKYPFVMVHGFIGFDSLVGTSYWYGLAPAMEKEGAKVLIAQINPSQTPEYRGEELIKLLKAWQVSTKATKFNLVGHSLGGPTVRYVASVRPDLVASATTVGGVNLGSKVADYMVSKGYISPGSNLDKYGTAALKLLAWATTYGGKAEDISAMVCTEAMQRANSEAFNAKYPEGAPAIQGTPTGSEDGGNGVKYYSITGNGNGPTVKGDLLDGIFKYTLTYGLQGIEADGLVETESQYWGKHLKTYAWNHLDEVNQVWGKVPADAANPKDVYRSLVQTIKSKGL